jgi:predicted metal-binding protein
VVSVCTSWCAPCGEAVSTVKLMLDALVAVLLDQAPHVTVRPVQCRDVCTRPATIAVCAPQGYTFVFGDLGPDHGAAIATFAKSYAQADYGFVP